MARAGLGPDWNCLFANDFDFKKSATYNLNWGAGVLTTADIRQIKAAELPGYADLAWASFPCQDLSLAGGGAGLKGERSGTFWPFWDVMNGLIADDRAPKIIVVENVCGAITSHNGKDFTSICATFARAGYRFGALVMDAKHFLPQSTAALVHRRRPRRLGFAGRRSLRKSRPICGTHAPCKRLTLLCPRKLRALGCGGPFPSRQKGARVSLT